MSAQKKGFVSLLQEFSIPLIAGVFAALIAANVWPEWYVHVFGASHGGGDTWRLPIPGLHLTPHFLINDIFMVFFFGIAAKEITESCLPGGDLNPPRKALNPLFATLGGVIGPVGVFFLSLMLLMRAGAFPEDMTWAELHRGWGIPTATDIALAWLVARAVFGTGHPAINFLLLLAVADDAIGLVIIAIFYGDPEHPARPAFLLLVLAGMAVAWMLRKKNVRSWVPYIALGGPLAWSGLILAHLHPALALVFIVPFLPGPKRDVGLFAEGDEIDRMGSATAKDLQMAHSPLHNFEHQLKLFVDFGLFFFALGNAGVALKGVGWMTAIILGSLVVGKTVGISLLGLLAVKLGFPLPNRMGVKELGMAGFIAALGLTVALFVSGAAFPTNQELQGEAKMGALLSGFVGLLAIALGRALGLGRRREIEPNGGGMPSHAGSGESRPAEATDARAREDVPGALPAMGVASARDEERD